MAKGSRPFLEAVHRMAGHADSRTIKLYDRHKVNSAPSLNMRMYFIVLRNGIFLRAIRGVHTKRKFKYA